jgi:pyruvate kinase
VDEIEVLGERLTEIYSNIIRNAQQAKDKFQTTLREKEHERVKEKLCSRDNLFCYLALRKQNISDLQLRLAEEGLSSLGTLESHVLVGIERVLKHFAIPAPPTNASGLCKINSYEGSTLLTERSELLLGPVGKGRSTRIMVTLDSSDIYQNELMQHLLENGMDLARINCAHNTEREWKLIIETLRGAEEQLVLKGKRISGSKCTILMDLAGPKIRTGPMKHKVRSIQISAPKDIYGRPVSFSEGYLDTEASQTEVLLTVDGSPSNFVIAISKTNYGGLGSLKIGQKIIFKDARDERSHTITVLERTGPTRVRIGIEDTAFLNEGTKLECQIDDADQDDKCSFTVGAIKAQPIELNVEAGNKLRLYKDTRLGHASGSDSWDDDDSGGDGDGDDAPAAISCTHPEILDHVRVGHRVFIDDGKIEAIVSSSNEAYLELEIISPKGRTGKIKSNKGINFPDSAIGLPALTTKDIKDLDFVSKYANIVGLSFVHGPQDIYDLHRALSKLGRADFGIIAKIETSDSVHNLGMTLIAGLELPKFAILIARGDLAVEVGFENLAYIQEDILCLCEAAHIPVILATQILESLAESGLRSRAEIADAIMGQRAECVMLNNGPHIIEAIEILSRLLGKEERLRHQIKKLPIFRDFTEQYGVFGA